MPEPLRAYAAHQPVSATADAVRALLRGGPTGPAVTRALLWALGMTAVFGVLAVRRYRRVALRSPTARC